MKKFLAMVVAVAMVLSLVAVPAFAMTQTAPAPGNDESRPGTPVTPADAGSFTVEAPATAAVGEEFSVTVNLNGTYEAHGLNFQLNYDANTFEAVGTTRGDVLMQVIDLGGTQILDYTTIPGSVRLGVMMPTDGFTAQGSVFTVRFVVKEGAANGIYNIMPVVTEFFNMPIGGSNTPIESTAVGAAVEVTGGGDQPTPAPTDEPTEVPTEVPTEAPTEAPTNPPAPGGNATVVLNVPEDIWGDGTGYQMLLDADATAFGTIIPATGTFTGTSYADFEYKIPENADCSPYAQNFVINGSVAITVPAGTYDYVITNPDNAGTIWIATDYGTAAGRADDFVFEANKTYTFTLSMGGQNDRVDLEITDSGEPQPTPTPTSQPTNPPVEPTDPPAPGGYATVVLNLPADVWGDGSGYQMLLDADATAYGSIIPETGGLTQSGNAPAGVYEAFEYKIPENADGVLTTQNIIVTGQGSVMVPAGTYDWCITNPTPGDRIWIASSNGSIPGRYDNYQFEAGKTYTFTVSMGGQNDRVDLEITDSGEPQPTAAPTSQPTNPPVQPTNPPAPGPDGLIAGYYFETDEDVNAWTFLGVDNTNWVSSDNNPGGYDYTAFAHEGSRFILSYSFVDYVGAYQADNWAISPAVTLPNGSARVSFYASNANSMYPETFSVYVGLAPDVNSMVLLQGNINAPSGYDDPWTHYEFDLSEYAGNTIYLAFYDNMYDGYEIWIDQVEFFGEGGEPQPTAEPTAEPTAVPTEQPTQAPIVTPAPGQVGFYVEAPESVEPGEEFEVSVRIEGEYEAHGLNLQLNYDEANFEVLGTTRGDVLMQVIDLGGTQIIDHTTIAGSVRVGVMMPTDPFTAEGIIFTARFKASESIANGSYGFIPVVAEFINFPLGGENTPIDNVAVPAYVTVGTEPTEPPVEPTEPPVEPTEPPMEQYAELTVPDYEAAPGELVPVELLIDGNYLAHGLTLTIDYDTELLTIESIESGPFMHEIIAREGFNVLDYETIPGSIRYAAVAPVPENPFSGTGNIFTVNFRVSENAEVGSVLDLDLEVLEMVYMPDSHEQSVDLMWTDGTITIVDEPVQPTEPPVEPTEPPVEPTEPPVEPTEPPVEPTEPPVEPTEPPVEPTAVPGEPTPEPTTPPAPPTGTIAMVGAGIAAVVAGAGIVLFRKKED